MKKKELYLPQFSTPMMKQYRQIKSRYMDCLLFYRMGDFYELFLEDAHIGANVLSITLTAKKGGKDGKIPMAGVPYHAVDSYIAKLVKAGYKVAICEQLSPPNKRGIVERDVVRVVTPGTLLDEHSLEKKENNYIISIVVDEDWVGFSVADLSTGFFAATQKEKGNIEKFLHDELSRIKPTECILPDELYNDPDFLKILRVEKLNIFPSRSFQAVGDPNVFLKKHFKVKTLEAFGLTGKPLAVHAASALLGYLKETQKSDVSHIKKIHSAASDDGMMLDRSTIINLELFSTIREHDTRGSLLNILDQTQTAMGGRILKQWMKKPLVEKNAIEERLDAVSLLFKSHELREALIILLREIPDIERLLSRLSVGLGNARDIVNLKIALILVQKLKKELSHCGSIYLVRQAKSISDNLQNIIDRVDTVVVEDPPISIRDGRMIQAGVDKELDKLKKRIIGSKKYIAGLEISERERSGISSLKVRFNKVFGFYIEISKSNLEKVPDNYMRKQTLVNAERFITSELKEHEEIILSAEEKINELEYKLFTNLLHEILQFTESIQDAAQSIAVIDCLVSFSTVSIKNRFVRPKLLYSGEIRIKDSRHPVVETLLEDNPFVPNDVTLDNVSQSMLLLTGPNMAGKSVIIRQVAIIVLMSQIGCFVPAKSAHVAITDRIFVRSGASDIITSGLSTFMVEMVETAYILRSATSNSLIVLDEIGRGTSTYDGISIAYAVAEYLATRFVPSPKVLFASHYHELQALEAEYPARIKNFHMAVTEQNGEPVFLHTILPGGASHSFGIAVAKLAGVPQEVVERATVLLAQLEKRSSDTSDNQQYEPTDTLLFEHLLNREFESLDVANMTPLAALNKLAEIKEKIKKYFQQNENLHQAD